MDMWYPGRLSQVGGNAAVLGAAGDANGRGGEGGGSGGSPMPQAAHAFFGASASSHVINYIGNQLEMFIKIHHCQSWRIDTQPYGTLITLH